MYTERELLVLYSVNEQCQITTENKCISTRGCGGQSRKTFDVPTDFILYTKYKARERKLHIFV